MSSAGRTAATICVAAGLVAAVVTVPGSARATESAAVVGTAPCAGAAHPGGDWPSYGHDPANTRHQPAAGIGPADAPTLAPAWTFSTVAAGGAGDITGTPVVVDGCVYVGTNSGWVFALNADTGEVVWGNRVPAGGQINSTVAVADGRVIAGVSRTSAAPGCTGDCVGPYAVAFDQPTGAIAWSTPSIDDQAGSDLYSTPVVFEGRVMIGISGGSAELGDETDRYAFQGNMVFLDATDGSVIKKTWTIHPPDQPADDFAGAGVWSTAAVDPVAKVAYVGTANPFRPQAEHAHANAVIKVDVDPASPTFGEIVGSYKGDVDEYVPGLSELPCYDVPGNAPPYYPQGIGSCGDIDLDFGASPNLFADPASGRLLVGAGQKSGVYHVFDAATMADEWSAIVGPPSAVGGIVGSTAVDGDGIYGPVTVPGHVWKVGFDGLQRWFSPTADGVHWGNPVAAAGGVVYTVDFKGFLDAYHGATGAPLLHRPIVAGADTGTAPVVSWGGVSIARDTVYTAVGISGLPSGFVVAFRPSADVGPLPLPEPPTGPEAPDAPADVQVVSGPGSITTNYYTPVVAVRAGMGLSTTNLDIALHDVVSDDGLFQSPLIGLGETAPVAGVEELAPGQYSFYCTLHRNMRGTLVVTP